MCGSQAKNHMTSASNAVSILNICPANHPPRDQDKVRENIDKLGA